MTPHSPRRGDDSSLSKEEASVPMEWRDTVLAHLKAVRIPEELHTVDRERELLSSAIDQLRAMPELTLVDTEQYPEAVEERVHLTWTDGETRHVVMKGLSIQFDSKGIRVGTFENPELGYQDYPPLSQGIQIRLHEPHSALAFGSFSADGQVEGVALDEDGTVTLCIPVNSLRGADFYEVCRIQR